MGGPLWTAPEEDYFWQTIVPQSDKRIGHVGDRDGVKTWVELAKEMTEHMTAVWAENNQKPLRKYTDLTLHEHWDKNVMQDRINNNAKKHVEPFLVEMEAHNPDRWARRMKRLGKKISNKEKEKQDKKKDDEWQKDGKYDDDDKEETGPKDTKRRRTSRASTVTGPTPSTGGYPYGPPTSDQGPPKPIAVDLAEYDLGEERQTGQAESETPSRQPSRHLLPAQNLERSLQPTSRPGAPAGPRYFPGTNFRDYNDNPFANPPPDRRADNQWVTRAEAERMAAIAAERAVQEAVPAAIESRMGEINDLVRQDIRQVVRDEVARQIATLPRQQLIHAQASIAPGPGPRTARVKREQANPERRTEASGSLQQKAQRSLSTASFPQQQAFNGPAGRGAQHAHRLPPMGHFRPPLVAFRTPLPAGPGQFPTSNIRSGTLDRPIELDEDMEEEEEVHRHRA